MTSKTTGADAPNRGIDEVLNETEIGSFISRYKMPLSIAVILFIAGIVGYGIYNEKQSSRIESASAVVQGYEKNHLSKFTDKADPQALIAAFNTTFDKISDTNLIFATGLKTTDALMKEKKFSEALQIIDKLVANKASNAYLVYLINVRKAVLLENTGQIEQAIALLETMGAAEPKVLEAKRYLDLGRLYMKKGDNAKAGTNLDYLIQNFADSQEAKIAKILKQKL